MHFTFAALALTLLPTLALAQGRFHNFTAAETACVTGCAQTIAGSPGVAEIVRTCKNQTIFDAPQCYCNSQKYLYAMGACTFDTCQATNATEKVFEQCNPFGENGAGINGPDVRLMSYIMGAGVIVASVLLG